MTIFFAANECLDLLFSSEGVRWHLVDILDRFVLQAGAITPKNNYSPSKKPTFPYTCQDGARVLLGKDTTSKTAIRFDGHNGQIGEGLNFNGRSGVEGDLPEPNMWVR